MQSLKQNIYPSINTVILVNVSLNDSKIQLMKKFPDLEILQTGEKLSYLAGMNYGIKKDFA
jgi:hypothetical protein